MCPVLLRLSVTDDRFPIIIIHEWKGKNDMKKWLLPALVLVLTMGVSGMSSAGTTTVWDTNWNVMTLWQSGSAVSGEYIYDKGVLTGTMTGNLFQGYWREYNNSKGCGPNNEWCGPVVFKFAADGKSFTGDWGYCSTALSSLNPDGSGWTGTLREGAQEYTQSECESAGRYWCSGACQINPCNETLTQTQCEAAGMFWCSGTCQYTDCSSTDPSTDECDIRINGITVSGTREAGSAVTFTMNADNSCSGTIYYRFSYHGGYGTSAYDGKNWKLMTASEYTTDNAVSFTFDEAGYYVVVVWAKNAASDPNTLVKLIGLVVEIKASGEEPYFPF